jgi:hypothetical protein
MENWASIQIRNTELEIRFEWVEFNGDDGFNEFHLDIVGGTETRRFDFGPCAIATLRKFADFFQGNLETASAAFQCPDVRVCELARTDKGFQLLVRFEADNQREEFNITGPSIAIDDFLSEYDGGSAPHH